MSRQQILSMTILARVALERRWRRLRFETQIVSIAIASIAIVTALLLMLDLQPRTPTELPTIVVPAPEEPDFDVAWRDAVVPMALLSASLTIYQMPKTDRAPLAVEAPPVLEPVVVQASALEVDEQSEPDAEPAVKPRRRTMNLCERHHLRKVITRGGKSWRCRR